MTQKSTKPRVKKKNTASKNVSSHKEINEVAKDQPWLIQGKPISLLDLGPSQFEDFLCQVLEKIGPHNNFKVVGKIDGAGGDKGFDIEAERISQTENGSLVCIQCKRYKNALDLSHVALEVAKVAFNSFLDRSKVIDHYIITAGTVAQTVPPALREHDRQVLLEAALKQGLESDELENKKMEIKTQGGNPEEVIKNYVQDPNRKFFVWNRSTLNNKMGVEYNDKILPIIKNFFQIERVLCEYPRPDFNMTEYLEKIKENNSKSYWPITLKRGVTPYGLEDSLTQPILEQENEKNQLFIPLSLSEEQSLDPILLPDRDTCTLLTGTGGAGKTTSLQFIARKVADLGLLGEQEIIPVFIKLSSYRGNLDSLIQETLEIKYGNWKSIPNPFLFLLDSIEEIPSADVKLFFAQLSLLVSQKKLSIRVFLSLRKGGLAAPVAIPKNIQLKIFDIQNFSYRDLINIATHELSNPKKQQLFLTQIRHRLNWRILHIPLGVDIALFCFQLNSTLPATERELLKEFTKRKFKEDHTHSGLGEKLQTLPPITLEKLQQAIAFEFRLNHQTTELDGPTGYQVLSKSIERMKNNKDFGANSIKDGDVFNLARHFEMVVLSKDGRFSIPHGFISDYLASPILAQNWRNYLPSLNSRVSDDAWIFASAEILALEQEAFLYEVAQKDLILAAYCAKEMGETGIQILEPIVLERESLPGAYQGSIYEGYVSATVMAILATPLCKISLEMRLGQDPSDSDRVYQAKKALAQLGDEKITSEILEWGIRTRMLLPDVQPQLALELSRKKIQEDPSSSAVLMNTLQVILEFGDRTDIGLLEEVWNKAENHYVTDWVIDCFKMIAPEIIILHLQRWFSTDQNVEMKIYAAEKLVELGQPVEGQKIVKLVVELLSTSPEKSYIIVKGQKLILANLDWSGMGGQMKQIYPTAPLSIRRLLWIVAGKQQWTEFDDMAIGISSLDLEEVACAVRFISQRQWSEERTIQFQNFVLQFAQNDLSKLSIFGGGADILEYLLTEGFEEKVKNIVIQEITELSHGKKERDEQFDLGNRSNESDWLSVELKICQLLPICTKIKDKLPNDFIKDLLSIIWKNFISHEALVAFQEICKLIDDQTFDSHLLSLTEIADRVMLLIHSGHSQPTPIRMSLIEQAIPIMIFSPLLSGARSISTIVERFWSSEVLRLLAEAISDLDWDEEDHSFQWFRDCMEEVGRRITKKQAEDVIAPHLQKALVPASRKILQFWYECGIHQRTYSLPN